VTPGKPDYLNPGIPANLPRVRIPVIDGTPDSLRGYGELIDAPDARKVEIVRWPAKGWRPVDLDSGDEGGTTEGVFVSRWQGDVLFGRNEAVGGHYILGYGADPSLARDDHDRPADRILLWHANYHPDGGQLFFPLEPGEFLVPLALPGDDVRPEQFVCFRFDGTRGALHPPRHLARRRLHPRRHAAILRSPGSRARQGLGRFPSRVQLPGRSGADILIRQGRR